MPKFGKSSLRNLAEVDIDLQRLFKRVVETYDCSIIEGYRSKEKQDEYFEQGKSKLKYPASKHNRTPSLAVDAIPYPVDWENTKQFYHFAGFVMATAKGMNIPIRWGGDWNGNLNFDDQSFHDLPHFELV